MRFWLYINPLFSFIFICLTFPCWLVGGKTCSDAYSCINGVVSDISTDIFCHGYFSCSNASLITIIDPAQDVYISCGGAYSCYNSELINASVIEVGCEGLYSCAMIDEINLLNNSELSCTGELSCYNSIIYRSSGDGSITCSAERSCQNSIIKSDGGTAHQFSGNMAASNTILSTRDTGNDQIYYSFYGRDSGYNASIICESSDTCNIYCYGNGCNNLNVTCLKHAGVDCTVNYYCNSDAEKSNICPNGLSLTDIISPRLDELPILLTYDGMTSYNTSAIACDNILSSSSSGQSFFCDDYGECSDISTLHSTSDNPSAICCLARSGCQGTIDNITSFINLDAISSDVIDQVSIRCDGYFSCYNLAANTKIEALNGGNIYFSGHRAVETANILVKTTNEYNVYCTNTLGCRYITIKSVNNVYCLAMNTCQDVDIYNVNYVYGYAYNSNYQSRMYNVKYNVYCASYQACYDSRITYVAGNVYAYGYNTMYNSIIKSIVGNVYGFGYASLAFTTISNVSEVYCAGENTCTSALISNVEKVRASGSEVLANAKIVSNLKDGATFVAFINGSHSEQYEIYCNLTNICVIHCQSSAACANLVLTCYGPCYVDCNEPFTCPSGDFALWSSVEPTSIPTSLPTDPSIYPTVYPTNSPTIDLKFTTTGVQTAAPIHTPSYAPTVGDRTGSPSPSPTIQPTTATTMTATATEMTSSSSSTTTGSSDAPQITGNPEQNKKGDSGGNLEWLIYAVPVALVLMCGFIFGYQWYLRRESSQDDKDEILSSIDGSGPGSGGERRRSSKKRKKSKERNSNIIPGNGMTPGNIPSQFDYTPTPGGHGIGNNNHMNQKSSSEYVSNLEIESPPGMSAPNGKTHLAGVPSYSVQSIERLQNEAARGASIISVARPQTTNGENNNKNNGDKVTTRDMNLNEDEDLNVDDMFNPNNNNNNNNETQGGPQNIYSEDDDDSGNENMVYTTTGNDANMGEGNNGNNENNVGETEGESNNVALEMAYQKSNINNDNNNDETLSAAIGTIRKAIIRAKREITNMNENDNITKQHGLSIERLLNIINQESLDYQQRLKIIQIDNSLKDSKPQELGIDLLEILQTMTL